MTGEYDRDAATVMDAAVPIGITGDRAWATDGDRRFGSDGKADAVFLLKPRAALSPTAVPSWGRADLKFLRGRELSVDFA